MKLKRARLADDLNEKIAQRPGPMELVEKNILPVDSSVKEAIIGKTLKLYSGRKSLAVLEKTNLLLKASTNHRCCFLGGLEVNLALIP